MSADLQSLEQLHQSFIDARLNLDITRGKPSSEQLDLSNELLNAISVDTVRDSNDQNVDLRNYGVVSGLLKSKQWFADLLDIPTEDAGKKVFVGGNSSLSLMHFSLWLAYFQGIKANDKSWQQEAIESGGKIKMICPVPGYDRHFSLCEELGIEMLPVPMTESGPDMEAVKQIVSNDPLVKGIWCVPRFSNPTGEVYSDETVDDIATLGKIAGDNFLVFWDNAYSVHVLADEASELSNIFPPAIEAGCEDNILEFASTSKITFAGAGVAALASSSANIAGFTRHFGFQSIGPDKINQLRHLEFLPDMAALNQHMQKHAKLLKSKFDLVESILETEFGNSDLYHWTKPEGGYFVSFDTPPGLATKVITLAAEAGVKLTPAGSTFPKQNDPEDKNIRLAPSYPEIDELEQAMRVFCNCVKLCTARSED